MKILVESGSGRKWKKKISDLTKIWLGHFSVGKVRFKMNLRSERLSVVINYSAFKRVVIKSAIISPHPPHTQQESVREKIPKSISTSVIRAVLKISSLKLYLPRKKWIRDEKLIFFKIQDMFKKCRNWSSIHIYPTPPLGQDMTQGQFLSGV